MAQFPNPSRPNSLEAQIRAAERQVSSRQRRAAVRAAALATAVRRQISAPSSLLLAGGAGFILGELTRPQVSTAQGAAGQASAAGATPLRAALNLLGSARALYTGLVPMALMLKSLRQPRAAGLERQRRPAAASAADKPAADRAGHS